jgi:hypothetical protein
VAALANKLGRLVRTLHLFNTAVCGPSWILLPQRKQERLEKTICASSCTRASPGAERARLIRGLCRKSQLPGGFCSRCSPAKRAILSNPLKVVAIACTTKIAPGLAKKFKIAIGAHLSWQIFEEIRRLLTNFPLPSDMLKAFPLNDY